MPYSTIFLKRFNLLIVGLLCFCGCQYHFAPHPAYFGDSFYIDLITNKSSYPWLGPELQKAITLELIKDRSLKLVEREKAEIIISGTITSVKKNLRESDQFNQASESQFVINLDLKVKNSREVYKTSISNLHYKPASSTYRPTQNSLQQNSAVALTDEKEASLIAVKDLAKAILIDYSQRSPSRFNSKIIEDFKSIHKAE